MTALALKGLLARRRRLAGTFFAVFIGVAFLAGALVLGSTLARNFDALFRQANAGTDAEVRSSHGVDSVDGVNRGQIDATLLARVRALPGVRAAEPEVTGYGQLLGADGKAIGGNGPPRTAGNWIATPSLNAYRLVAGRAPRAPGEVVINRGAADSGKLAIGDTTVLQTPAPVRVRIVGLATFGSADGFGESTFAGLTTAQAQRLLLHRTDRLTGIRVAAAPGVSQTALVRRLRAVLPAGTEAITGEQLNAEDADEISGSFLTMLRVFLVVFAGIALLVAAFSINNTLSIVAAQRTRESALLRALGASRAQVARLLASEALIVGAAASVAGVLGGLGMATGLKALFSAFGGALPDGGLVLSPATVLVSLAVGVLVTLAAGVRPALRAGRVAPVAALRETAAEAQGRSRVGRLATLAGRPLRGATGAIARENATRNPRRTASTAAALAVGIAVVTLATVAISSLKAAVQDDVAASFAGDLAITAPGFGQAAVVDPGLAKRVAALPQVDVAVGIGTGPGEIAGKDVTLSIADFAALDRVSDLGARGALSVSRKAADAHGWHVGSRVRIGFVDGTAPVLRVGAIYGNGALAGDYLLSRAAWAPHAQQDLDKAVFITLRDPSGRAAVARLAGQDDVRTRAEYIEDAAGGFNALLGFVYVMLLLAIVIALMGIANTLALSVHERTHELGVLRAVGATRRQVRAIVRGEAVIVAALGTAAGVVAGVVLGAALVLAASVGTFEAPPGRLVAIAAIGALAGVLAAIRPARRASRLNVSASLAAGS